MLSVQYPHARHSLDGIANEVPIEAMPCGQWRPETSRQGSRARLCVAPTLSRSTRAESMEQRQGNIPPLAELRLEQSLDERRPYVSAETFTP